MIDLQECRNEIDKIDSDIIRLFEQRMKVCEDVAEYKIRTGKKVLDPERERQKLEVLRGKAHGEFNQLGAQELFQQIMAISGIVLLLLGSRITHYYHRYRLREMGERDAIHLARSMPKGGVHRPIIMLKMTTRPKCTRSIPRLVAMGIIRGTKTTWMTEVSMNMPRIRMATFTTNRKV